MLFGSRLSVVVLLALVVPLSGWAQNPTVLEASGIVRHGDYLLIVDDEQNGVYFRYCLQPADHGPLIRLEPEKLERMDPFLEPRHGSRIDRRARGRPRGS